MSEDQLRDIESIKSLEKDAARFQLIKRAMPFLRPFLKVLGVDVARIDKALDKVDAMSEELREFASIFDRFNDIFLERGWISYDLMNFEVTKAAVYKAESGDIDGAEADLVEYYSPDTVRWKLSTMYGIKAFRPRMRLAELALIDYEEGRYHACIPVVLALIDGLVTELHPQRRGLFAEGTDLTAWDSLAAHSKGLNALAQLLNKGRRMTRTEEITVPYRHGIVHGMDLGYDTEMVAAKTWATLFAVRDWAMRAQNGLLTPPPDKPEKSVSELMNELRELNEDKARLEKWQPRSIVVGIDIPVTGEPKAYLEGSPEQRLAEFLQYWKKKNYGYMAQCAVMQLFPNELPAHMREVFDPRPLKSFEFLNVIDTVPAITEIETQVIYEQAGTENTKNVKFRLHCQTPDGQPATWGKPGSQWGIVNYNIF